MKVKKTNKAQLNRKKAANLSRLVKLQAILGSDGLMQKNISNTYIFLKYFLL